jgi:hypothetical protein
VKRENYENYHENYENYRRYSELRAFSLMEKGLPDTEKPFAIMAVSLLVLCPAVNLIVLFSHQEGGKKKTEALNNVVRETNQKQ